MGIISMNSATNHHLSNRAKNCSLLASLALSTTALLFSNNFVYAESTSSSANASVTVSDTIRLTLTGGDLVINNLTPGTSADSNIITATVTSNSPYGFHLSATTGTKNGTTSLVNTADSNFVFTNLDSNKASLSNFSDNTWGYSYSTNNGTSWVSGDYGTATQTGYNGLALDNDDSGATGTTLFNSDTYTNSTAVKFKIGAKSSQTQASGTYTGTVNFYAVTNPKPIITIANATTMQEVEACPESVPMETVYTLTDPRDNQTYKVARLKDGKCWMVENLNLAGGTALSSDDTDVTSEYINSFSTSNNLTKTGDTIVLPASSTSGFDTSNYAYIYNSGKTGTDCSDPGCYSYYSWDAATLGSGRSINTDNTDALYSICPKGWRLPTSGAQSNNGWKRGDFYKLATAYGANLESNYYDNSPTFNNNAGPNTTVPKFLLAGGYGDGSFSSGGSSGFYWSSTSYSNTSLAHGLYFYSSSINSAYITNWHIGFSVRCLLKAE